MKNPKMIYFLFLFACSLIACGSDDADIIEEPEEPEQPEEITIAGEYIGDWTSDPEGSNFYDRIAASARISKGSTDSTWVGSFYFTRSFVSCCQSGADDGSLSFILSGNKISRFVYNDVIPNCNGTFSGEGSFSNNNTINITFTGNDCEGEHTGGILKLVKN